MDDRSVRNAWHARWRGRTELVAHEFPSTYVRGSPSGALVSLTTAGTREGPV